MTAIRRTLVVLQMILSGAMAHAQDDAIMQHGNSVYDAAVREATRRYRGDILPHRDIDSREIPRVEEVRHVEHAKPDDAFAPKPFTLRSTAPAPVSPAPDQ